MRRDRFALAVATTFAFGAAGCVSTHTERGTASLAPGESRRWVVDGLNVDLEVRNAGPADVTVTAVGSGATVPAGGEYEVGLNHAASADPITVTIENAGVGERAEAEWVFRGPLGWTLRESEPR